MKLQQIVGKGTISNLVRYRLENSHYAGSCSAAQLVQREFPNHIVSARSGRIAVQVRDRSFSVAVFKEVHE